jgi:hypothetical protein
MLLSMKKSLAVSYRDKHAVTTQHGIPSQSHVFFCFFFIHLFICAYNVWAISHPQPPHLQAEIVLPFSPILLKSRHDQ